MQVGCADGSGQELPKLGIRNIETRTAELATRKRGGIGTVAAATGWQGAGTVAARWVAVTHGYIRTFNWLVEKCQGGVAGGVPPHKGGP